MAARISNAPFTADDEYAARDGDELLALRDRQATLLAELQHRTFNLLAVVRGMVGALLRSSGSLDEFGSRFEARIDALSRAHRLLSRHEGGVRVALDELVCAELEAAGVLGDERVCLEGPAGIGVRSSSVGVLAMALHELAANALEHGALAHRGTRLRISWCVTPGDAYAGQAVRLHWRELGVATSGEDACRFGHGRMLIERALPYELKANTAFTLMGDGLECSIVMPASE